MAYYTNINISFYKTLVPSPKNLVILDKILQPNSSSLPTDLQNLISACHLLMPFASKLPM